MAFIRWDPARSDAVVGPTQQDEWKSQWQVALAMASQWCCPANKKCPSLTNGRYSREVVCHVRYHASIGCLFHVSTVRGK